MDFLIFWVIRRFSGRKLEKVSKIFTFCRFKQRCFQHGNDENNESDFYRVTIKKISKNNYGIQLIILLKAENICLLIKICSDDYD